MKTLRSESLKKLNGEIVTRYIFSGFSDATFLHFNFHSWTGVGFFANILFTSKQAIFCNVESDSLAFSLERSQFLVFLLGLLESAQMKKSHLLTVSHFLHGQYMNLYYEILNVTCPDTLVKLEHFGFKESLQWPRCMGRARSQCILEMCKAWRLMSYKKNKFICWKGWIMQKQCLEVTIFFPSILPFCSFPVFFFPFILFLDAYSLLFSLAKERRITF